MYRNREARRASIVGSNDFKGRRHRTNSLRESPEEDAEVDLQQSGSLRDRGKKDRDREREKDRDRDREDDRDLRERPSSRSKRRRAERFAGNREDAGKEETSDESVDDNEDYEDEESAVSISASGGGGGVVRVLPPAVGSMHGNVINHHLNHSGGFAQSQHHFSSNSIISCNQLQHRKTFPPSSSSKLFRAVSVRKSGDEMIGVSVPRKARSACTKRSHDWMSSSSNNNNSSVSGVIGEQVLVQASSSPASESPVSTTAPLLAGPVSPSSTAPSIKKKLKLNSGGSNGLKVKPPKMASNASSSNPEELEIEIAEVLYGLKTQSQDPSLKKEESREVTRLSSDAKSLISSAISYPASTNPVSAPNSSRLMVVAPKRKRPRQVVENLSYGVRISPILEKPEIEHTPKAEATSPKTEKMAGSATENGYEMVGDSAKLQARTAHFLELKARESLKMDSDFASRVEEVREGKDLVKNEEIGSNQANESSLARTDVSSYEYTKAAAPLAAVSMTEKCSMVPELENQKEKKFAIDLMMDPSPQVKLSPGREAKIDSRASAAYEKPSLSLTADSELKTAALMDREYETEKGGKAQLGNVDAEEEKARKTAEEDESTRPFEKKVTNNDLHLDLAESSMHDAVDTKLQHQARKQQQQMPLKTTKEEPLVGKSCQPSNSLPVSLSNGPGGLPPGYVTSMQAVAPVGGGAAVTTPAPIQGFNQPRPKRCETHCYIARNISYIQQFMKMNPFWTAATAAPFLGAKPSNLSNVAAPNLHGGHAFRGVTNSQGQQNLASTANHGGSEKNSQAVSSSSDSVQRKQQILLQPALQPVAPNNLLGPAFIFPLNQQQAAAAAASTRPGAPKSHTNPGQVPSTASTSLALSSSNTTGPAAGPAVSFNYPNMGPNETQYLAILQNNAYPFPIPAVGGPPNYRGNPAQPMPLFTGPFYSSQMIHPSQLQHQHPSFSQPAQPQPAHKNSSSSSCSSSQKHLQNQQLRSQSTGVANGALGNTNRPRHVENELGEGNAPVNIHPQNFALMAPPAGAATSHGAKAGVSPLPPHSFAMSFGPINGDLSNAQNYAIFQSFPDSTRQGIQLMGAAAQVSQKKNSRISEDVKSRGEDPCVNDDEGKGKSFSGKAQGGAGQSIGVARSNLVDSSTFSTQPNGVIDGLPPVSVPNVHNDLQAQLRQQHVMQLMQQQQLAAAAASNPSKAPGSTNGNIYSEQLSSLSGFPQNNGSSASKFPQWSNSSRTATPQAPSSHAPAPTASAIKNLPHQQHSRSQPRMHGQISFGGNQKPSPTSPGHVSPSNSSISKGSGGSPRTTPATTNKSAQPSSLAAHQPKQASSMHPSQKSQSILGNAHVVSSGGSSKPHVQKQSHQQLAKNVQQTQLFFSNPYSQVQSSQTVNMQQRRRPEQHAVASTSSSGVLQLCQPVPLSNSSTNDPTKAMATAACTAKGGGSSSQGGIHSSQVAVESAGMILPVGFSYVQPVPAAVQTKPPEQKQNAG